MTRQKQLQQNGKDKAAVLLVSLGADISAEIYKHLTEEEIEELTLSISNVRSIDKETKNQVIAEFYQLALAKEYISKGGMSYAKQILEKALGPDEAMIIINKLTSIVRPFDFMRKADPKQILNYIQNEHPQTIALVLSYLEPQQSSQIISELQEDIQADVARRIALMDRTSPEIISQVEHILKQKLSVADDYTQTGGIETVVDVLNGVDRTTEKTILEHLDAQDPDLAEEIKKRLFAFEDIIALDDRSIQRLVREVNNEDLLLSLKTASDELKQVLFKNMSERMAETLKEEMEFMGPVQLREVEEAKTRIVNVIRKLEDAGEIVIARSGGDGVIV
ncbi:flagellar motor switch protein FliG [Scopulibacillus daqui]|uniref:Flagellar motor switch protein FliG n=1 Tax=Scopulibacillus daqui TaxID=1469162 RepID=A0ABS2PXQ2_9BACL|nr:flagellar motor switch protein FliG [Scopulibacillus daqui]MBM7644355.1 flagellar motor switch protein FliG [Scopulibacillus daqui]